MADNNRQSIFKSIMQPKIIFSHSKNDAHAHGHDGMFAIRLFLVFA